MSIFGDTQISSGRNREDQRADDRGQTLAADEDSSTAPGEAAAPGASAETELESDHGGTFAEPESGRWVALESSPTVDSAASPGTVEDPPHLLAEAIDTVATEAPIDIVEPVTDGSWVDAGDSWSQTAATDHRSEPEASTSEPGGPPAGERSWTYEPDVDVRPAPGVTLEPDVRSEHDVTAEHDVAAEPAVTPDDYASPDAGATMGAATFSTLLRDMFADLSASHDELQPDVQPVIDERDSVLGEVDRADNSATLGGILFTEARQFPAHILWLRHAGREITRLRRAELESDDALSNLSRLRDIHLRGGVASWSSSLPPSAKSDSGVSAAASGNARFGTLTLAAAAADRGPAPLAGLLRGLRRSLALRNVLRWVGRLLWAGAIGALLLAWNRAAFANAEYGAGAAAVLWLVHEFFVNPRLDARHLDRLRSRVRGAVEDFYSARLIALIEMGLIRSQLGRMDSPFEHDSRQV